MVDLPSSQKNLTRRLPDESNSITDKKLLVNKINYSFIIIINFYKL